ncbi:metallophosphoesterase [Bradyrhizobium elkanii]|uniref:metallophosphoesterase n=1 Tax=Bradyrhizobium elkanii TaxID=29448 RepID=UPI0030C74BE4
MHITDLHFTRTNAFQAALIRSLLDDLDRLRQRGYEPDFLVFSGDLVNNPDEADIYPEFETLVLQPILSRLGLNAAETIFCPGNHDVSQRAIAEWADERKRLVEAMASGQAQLDKHLDLAPAKAYARAISSGFFDLTERCGHSWTNPFTHHYHFPKKKIGFVAINSGYACGLEGSQYDRGKLAVSVNLALGKLQEVPTGHSIVSLMHHTMGDLAESCSRDLVPILAKRSSIHFFGHVHQPNPVVTVSPTGSCFMVQGGALYERGGQYNGYSCVERATSLPNTVAKFRTYYVDRQEFDVGTNVAPGGAFYDPPHSSSFWESVVPPPTNDDICLWLMDVAESAATELDATITGKSLRETFVEPAIVKQPHSENVTTTAQRFTIDDIIRSKDDTVICCPAEYGTTSILSYLVMRIFSECVNLPKAMVPAFLDGRRIRASYEAVLASTLRAALPESDDRQFRLGPLHDSGRLIIVIDDIDPTSNSHLSFLTGLREHYPRARLIVGVKLDLLNTDRLKPVIGIEKYDLLRIETLSRGKVRSLVEKWRLPAVYLADAVVDEIQTRFHALGIPQTPPYVAIYLSVLEETEGYNPINSSTVIENFVEATLQKYKPQYIFRSSFDYRNQIDYLGFIAEQMCRKNTFLIDYEQIYAWTRQYFDSIGVEHDFSKLIRHFVENKVFADEGNHLYFRYNIFLSFFTAHRMQQSKEFLDWLLSDYRFANFISELDIYCGLSRGDLGTLEVLGQKFSILTAALETFVKPLASTDRLEKLSIPAARKTDTEEFTESIRLQLTEETSPEARDKAMAETNVDEARLAAPNDKSLDDLRPLRERVAIVGELPQWIMTLRAYTVALKNLENIPKERKELHLAKILDGWSTLMLFACLAFKDSIESREIRLGPMKLLIDLPEKADARAFRMIFLTIPVVVSELVRRDLGSQKLALQLRNENLASSLSASFLQTALYADLKLNEYLGRLKAFRTRAGQSMIFQEALLIKMRELFLRLGLSEEDHHSFVTIAAEISAELKGLSGEDRQREIDRFTTELRKKDQVKRLREGAQ